jgi:hypothetical protein
MKADFERERERKRETKAFFSLLFFFGKVIPCKNSSPY